MYELLSQTKQFFHIDFSVTLSNRYMKKKNIKSNKQVGEILEILTGLDSIS